MSSHLPQSSRPSDREVAVNTEVETPRGWLFGATCTRGGGGESLDLQLTLSWVDYEYWSHGSHSPSRVAEAVLVALREAEPARELPPKFDASTARRWVREFDQRVRDAL